MCESEFLASRWKTIHGSSIPQQHIYIVTFSLIKMFSLPKNHKNIAPQKVLCIGMDEVLANYTCTFKNYNYTFTFCYNPPHKLNVYTINMEDGRYGNGMGDMAMAKSSNSSHYCCSHVSV